MNLYRHFLVIVLVAGLEPAACWGAALPRTVLYIDQSSVGFLGYSQIFQALQSSLRVEAKPPISIYAESLDSSHFRGEEYDQVLSTYLKEKYAKISIGTIVAVGSVALQFALTFRSQHLPEVPIVFAMVDNDTVTREPLPSAVTGNTIRMSLANAIVAARALVPEVKRIVLVGDPLETQPARRHFATELERLSTQYHFIDLTGLSLRNVRKRVAKLPADAAIVYTTMNRDEDGAVLLPRDALVSVAEAANRPIVIDVETYFGRGGTGGYVMLPYLVGRSAASLVLRVINGENPSQIPVTAADVVRPVFDWRELQRWQISEAALPSGSEIRFKPATAWEQYSRQIVLLGLALLLQAGLILALSVERWRRRGAEIRSLHLMTEMAHANRLATAGTLSASIAHEIRQPLSAIVSYGNAGLRWLTKDKADLDEVRTALRNIVAEGHRADQVIKEVRALFKRDDENRAPLDVNELIRDVLALARHELRKHDVVVETTLCEKAGPHVFADRIQLQQVMLNLIRNAIDAMTSGLSVIRKLTVTARLAEKDRIIVTVEDSGPGIDPKNMNKVFDAFFSTKPSGMGMGLSICRSIVETHGGTLTASRGKTHGAAFEINLPILTAEIDK
jgi:signal transduction histidine kinase